MTHPRVKKSRILNASVFILWLTIFASLIFPSAYICERPGPVADVLGTQDNKPLISINAKSKTNEKYGSEDIAELNYGESMHYSGELLLLTVSVYGGPGGYITSYYSLKSLMDTNDTVLPIEAVYKPNESAQEAKEETTVQMNTSQNSAKVAAIKYLQENNKPHLDSDDIVLQIDNIGGPSAGLIFALGIIQKSGVDITKGRIIAGTGTIDDDGTVGEIGGVQQKMTSAYKNGARILLVPTNNYNELKNIPSDLQVIPVETLNDAITALTQN